MKPKQLTLTAVTRPTSMRPIWRRTAIVAALACGLASAKVMANPNVRRPVAQFIYFYQQAQDIGDDMNLWERVVYSCLLTKTTAASNY
jgi:hypothetical protein